MNEAALVASYYKYECVSIVNTHTGCERSTLACDSSIWLGGGGATELDYTRVNIWNLGPKYDCHHHLHDIIIYTFALGWHIFGDCAHTGV